MSDTTTPVTPAELEEKRSAALMAQMRLRMPQTELAPATVLSWDSNEGLARIALDTADETTKSAVCHSMIEDVDPGERVYVQHFPPDLAVIVGRALPVVHRPEPDWMIWTNGGTFSVGNGSADASWTKRGPRINFDFSVAFGSGSHVGTRLWHFLLPVPPSSTAGFTNPDRTIFCGSGFLYNGASYSLTFTTVLADTAAYAVAWYDGAGSPLGGVGGASAAQFPGGNAALDGVTPSSGVVCCGTLSYPVD